MLAALSLVIQESLLCVCILKIWLYIFALDLVYFIWLRSVAWILVVDTRDGENKVYWEKWIGHGMIDIDVL